MSVLQRSATCRFMPIMSVFLVAALSLLSGCAQPRYELTWTPQQVAPPEDINAVIQSLNAEAMSNNEEVAVVDPMEAAEFDESLLNAPLDLTRDGAVLMSVARNKSLQVEVLNPEIASESIEAARAAFDPNLMAMASWGRAESVLPAATQAQLPPGVSTNQYEESLAVSASASQAFATGTRVTLGLGGEATETNRSPWETGLEWSAQVDQAILRGRDPLVSIAPIRDAELLTAQSREALRGFLLELVAGVELSYWDLALAEEALGIQEFSIELAEANENQVRNLVKFGLDVNATLQTARAETLGRQADLVDAKARVRRATVELIRLLNPDQPEIWDVTFAVQEVDTIEPFVPARDESLMLADKYRPELATARLDISRRQLDLIVTKDGVMPRLDGFARYSNTTLDREFTDATSKFFDDAQEQYELGLTFDLNPRLRAEKALRNQAQFREEQAKRAVENLEFSIEADVRDAIINIERFAERIAADQLALEARQAEVRVAEERFNQGLTTNLDLLQVQRDLIEAELQAATSRIRYMQALTNLYRAEGTLLARRGVTVPELQE